LRALLRNPIFPLFFILSLLAFTILPSHSLSVLNLTTTTNRYTYYVGDRAQIYGNLTLDNVTVTDGLVAIEVSDPRGTPIIIRTLSTGTIPPTAWYVYVQQVFASDQLGNPKPSFFRGELAYFNVTVINNDIEPRLTLVTVNVYDQNTVPLASASIKGTLPQQSVNRFIMGLPIPTDAALGTANVYANAYTDWPKLLGTPYCPEKTASFSIVGGAAAVMSVTAIQEVNPNYNLTIKLPMQIPKGIFTVYVSSAYLGLTAFNSTTMQVKMLGDINGDNIVNYLDVFRLLKSYLKREGDPLYDFEADFNRDGVVNYLDVYVLLANYLKTA